MFRTDLCGVSELLELSTYHQHAEDGVVLCIVKNETILGMGVGSKTVVSRPKWE